MQIAGNTILITGGGSGIGRGLAEALHGLGNQVIIAGRRREMLESVASANPGMQVAHLDVDDADAIRAFALAAVKTFPTLNVLINNAGIQRPEDLRSQGDDLAAMEAMVTTNLLGPIRLTAALLPLLRRQPRSVALNKPEEWIRSIDFSDAQAGLSAVAEQFVGWAPHLTNLIMGSNADPVLRPIYALPVDHEWPRTAGLTLIGDAAHLMSPFAGEGANLAMFDSAELAQAFIANPDDMEVALLAYERGLFPRSRDVAVMSVQNLKLFFGDTAPRSVADLFKRSAEPSEPSL